MKDEIKCGKKINELQRLLSVKEETTQDKEAWEGPCSMFIYLAG